MSTPACRHCGTALRVEAPVPRDSECPGCGRDVRACVQCRHYDPAYTNACRETEAEPVTDKERRNFCEFFELATAARPRATGDREAAARNKLAALFDGTAPAPDRSAEARRNLDALFRKPESDDDEG